MNEEYTIPTKNPGAKFEYPGMTNEGNGVFVVSLSLCKHELLKARGDMCRRALRT